MRPTPPSHELHRCPNVHQQPRHRRLAGQDVGDQTLLYTLGVVELNSNSLVIERQTFAGGVNFNANSDLTFAAIDVPGVGVSRFDEDIRQIVTD